MSITRKTRWAHRTNYGGTRTASDIRYIVLHYTANDGDTDEANGNYFATHSNLRASAHYFVDDDSVTQSVPELNVAYSVGGKKYGDCAKTGGGTLYGICTNANSISVEMCDTKRDGKVMASEKTQANAAELVRELMERFSVPIERVIRHFDVNGKHCPAYFMDESQWQAWKKRLGASATTGTESRLQALNLIGMDNGAIVEKVGPLFTADQKATGVLASVSMAQFILESDYGKSQLARAANNCFGMKKILSGNTWPGSMWDGISVYQKETKEQKTSGKYITITAEFRAYPNIASSIADHSAYLLGARNGDKLRYAGLKGCTDYRKAAQIIKDGGYATSLTYVDKLCRVVEQWSLTRFDSTEVTEAEPDAGCPYLVKVTINDLNIRTGPGVKYARVKYIPVGIYTIVEEQNGWGRLKSGLGWIKLSFCSRMS